jgi:hypothetical protein
MLSEEQFWSILEQARDGATTSASPQKLAEVLMPLSSEEVAAFGHQFYEKICDLNSYRLWVAGFVITGYMSDDSFHYFRSWIVGKGREVFELALANPDDLGPHIDNPEVDNELLEYIAVELCENRGLDDDPRDRTARNADAEPTGDFFPEESMPVLYPNLSARFS